MRKFLPHTFFFSSEMSKEFSFCCCDLPTEWQFTKMMQRVMFVSFNSILLQKSVFDAGCSRALPCPIMQWRPGDSEDSQDVSRLCDRSEAFNWRSKPCWQLFIDRPRYWIASQSCRLQFQEYFFHKWIQPEPFPLIIFYQNFPQLCGPMSSRRRRKGKNLTSSYVKSVSLWPSEKAARAVQQQKSCGPNTGVSGDANQCWLLVQATKMPLLWMLAALPRWKVEGEKKKNHKKVHVFLLCVFAVVRQDTSSVCCFEAIFIRQDWIV